MVRTTSSSIGIMFGGFAYIVNVFPFFTEKMVLSDSFKNHFTLGSASLTIKKLVHKQ